MNAIEMINIISSGASLVLAVVSIALAVYFFVQAKNSETSTTEALASIRSQTDALQKLTGRWMDRLTRYATEGNPANEHMIHILTAIREVPVTVARSIQLPNNHHEQVHTLTNEAIMGYIGILYYSAMSNVYSQMSLPNLDSFDHNNNTHQLIKKSVDSSASDVNTMVELLSRVASNNIDNSPLKHLYDEAHSLWIPLVKDSTTAYASREQSN